MGLMESAEHEAVGDRVRVPAGTGVSIRSDGVLEVVLHASGRADVTLTYGEVVALGGDFYGTPNEQPINSASSAKDRVTLFESAF